jgi:hypothetical protein
MKLKKLDKRMTGYGIFMYSVDFSTHDDTHAFAEVRSWCIEQWGNSVEVDIWQRFRPLRNPAWSWERNHGEKKYVCRIFLAGETEVSWFTLRWA